MMSQPPIELDKAHRWFAVELNNLAWELLASPHRTSAQTDTMLHAAHAACYHWKQVGTAVNHQRALSLVAAVHAELGEGELGLHFARQCLQLTEQHAADMADWDLAFAYECVARTHAAAGHRDEAAKFKKLARQAGDAIADPQDKEVFDKSFAARNWYGV